MRHLKGFDSELEHGYVCYASGRRYEAPQARVVLARHCRANGSAEGYADPALHSD